MKKIYKKTAAFLAGTFLSLSLFSAGALAGERNEISVYINETRVEFDVNPVIENDRTLVPMRAIFEALGAEIQWDDASRTVTATKGSDVIQVTIDDPAMRKNDQTILLDVPAKIVDERTLVPVRAISEGLDASVEWDAENQQVLIHTVMATLKPTALPSPSPSAKPVPEATATPEATGGPVGTLSYKELSNKDLVELKGSYDKIRYTFEQQSFPNYILTNTQNIVEDIKAKNEKAKSFTIAVWDELVINQILKIQTDSETTYDMKEVTSEEILQDYLEIVHKAGLDGEDYFDISFETMENKNTMMVLSFQKTDTLLACKYIGVLVTANDSARYFTAETDFSVEDQLFLGEVTKMGRGTLGLIGFEKSDFVKAINTILSSEGKQA